jgi:hypothetical protein
MDSAGTVSGFELVCLVWLLVTRKQCSEAVKEEFAILKAKGRSGSSVKTAVIKATRSELAAPKKKHVDYLLASTKGGKPNFAAVLKVVRVLLWCHVL